MKIILTIMTNLENNHDENRDHRHDHNHDHDCDHYDGDHHHHHRRRHRRRHHHDHHHAIMPYIYNVSTDVRLSKNLVGNLKSSPATFRIRNQKSGASKSVLWENLTRILHTPGRYP